MRSQLALRLRSASIPLSAVPPAPTSIEYSTQLADVAARILYRSPLPSQDDLPVFILNAAALPDAKDTEYDALLPYVLARLPDEEELIGGQGYEVVFFAGGSHDGSRATATKKGRPGWGWFLQAYHVLSRAMRKRLKRLYIVHEKNWIKILVEMFSTAVSPKFRKKIIHGTLSIVSKNWLQNANIQCSLYVDGACSPHTDRKPLDPTVGIFHRSTAFEGYLRPIHKRKKSICRQGATSSFFTRGSSTTKSPTRSH